jgi:hypothetical protein
VKEGDVVSQLRVERTGAEKDDRRLPFMRYPLL